MNREQASSEILALALAYHRAPLRYQEVLPQQAELPEGAGTLLRIAGGDASLAEKFCGALGSGAGELQDAAVFFMKQVFFAPGADHYRVLGLNRQAGAEQIKEHYRLLMRLFHPDREESREAWTDVFASRVNQAYTVLRNPEQRGLYDASLGEAVAGQRKVVRSRAFVPREHAGASGALPPFVRQYLPHFFMGGAALLATLFVAEIYLGREQPPPPGADQENFLSEAAKPAPVAKQVFPKVVAERAPEPPPPAVSRPKELPRPIVQAERAPPSIASSVAKPAPAAAAQKVPVVAQVSFLPKPVAEPTEEKVVAPPARHYSAGPRPTVAEPAEEKAVPSVREVAAMAPQPAPAAAPARRGAPGTELEFLVGRFVGAYEQGDLEGFLALLDGGVRTGEKSGKAAVRKDYEDLFRTTQNREMALKDMHWEHGPDAVRGEGRFSVRVLRRGERDYRRYSGVIRFDVAKRGGSLVITGLYHMIDKE